MSPAITIYFMQHYLITGGAGFIGSNLVKKLLDTNQDIHITCIDNFDPFYSIQQKQFNIAAFEDDPRFTLIKMDLGKTSCNELLSNIPQHIDVIIHLAAKAGVRPSIENPMAYQQSNVIGLQNLLEFTREKKVPQFVYASSSSVYGINDHFPWKEDEKLMPISPYAMTKLSGEMLGHVYSKLYGIRFIALRFFTVYGPGQRPDLAIHKFTKALLSDQPIMMYGNGETSRDYTYVDDIVEGIKSAIHYSNSNFEIINLGNHYSVSLMQLINMLEKVTGKNAVIEKLPEQPGDVPKTFADIQKARELLGYNPSTSLQAGLKKFYDWYVQNQAVLLNKY